MKLALLPQYPGILRRELRWKLSMHTVPCPMCGSRTFSAVFKVPHVNMAVFRSVFAERVVQCDSCALVLTNPRPSDAALTRYYSEQYRLEGLEVPRTLEEFVGASHQNLWVSKHRDLGLVLEHTTSGRLLDVGCASGTLLYLARESGFAVTGVDVAAGAVSFGRDVLGMPMYAGQLQDVTLGAGAFDVITMFHSLEHVPDPLAVAAEIRRLLAADGLFIGVVPNFGSWSSRKMGVEWPWLQPDNHYTHFTPETLRELLTRAGFSTTLRTEEGRYGDDELRANFQPAEIAAVHADMRGSEIVFSARKRSRTGR